MRAALNVFVRRALLFVLLLCALLVAVSIAGPPFGIVDYMAALRTKHERLSTTTSPRLVIIGGSNAAFGINSTELEQAIGMPVVNMALHASLGYRFMVNEVIHELREGDVLLVVPEHSQFQRPEKTQDILYSALERYPSAWRYVPWNERGRVAFTYGVKKLQVAVQAVIDPKVRKPEPVYRADGFDERGDLVSHLDQPSPGISDAQPMVGDRIAVDPQFWTITDEVLKAAQARHFKVLIAWPCQARSMVKTSIDQGLVEDLKAHDIQVVGRPENYVYPDSLFFDSKYHLAREGRELRTQRLIDDLKEVL